jgi:hypothetical protein
MLTNHIIQTQQVLALIHKGEAIHKRTKDRCLNELINSCVSILVLYLRYPSPRVTLQQLKLINKLREQVEADNIHTSLQQEI